MKVPMSDTRSAMSRFRKIKTRRGRHGLGNTTGADRLGSDILKRLYINLPSCSRVGGSAVFCVVFRTGMKELIGRPSLSKSPTAMPIHQPVAVQPADTAHSEKWTHAGRLPR